MLDVELDKMQLNPAYVIHGLPSAQLFWLFNIDTGEHYELNETAFWVLNQLAESAVSREDLLAKYLRVFEIKKAVAEVDLFEFLESLRDEGIIQ